MRNHIRLLFSTATDFQAYAYLGRLAKHHMLKLLRKNPDWHSLAPDLPHIPHSDSAYSENIPVDLVYSWVDGTDPNFTARREEWSRRTGSKDPQNFNPKRFYDNCELKLSLRSVEAFTPWINRIYIIVDRQVPKWLNTSHPKIQLIELDDIYPNKEWLPVFNSHALEFQLHRIPGLSENFLYSCDDMLFGQPCTKEDFFLFDPSGDPQKTVPRLSLTSYNVPYFLFPHPSKYRMAWCNLRLYLEREFAASRVSYILRHHTMPMCKRFFEQTIDTYPQLYAQVSASRFRHPTDVPPIGFISYRALLQEKSILADISAAMCHNLPDFMDAITHSTNTLLCINDQVGVGDVCNHLPGTGFLETPSSFEKAEN